MAMVNYGMVLEYATNTITLRLYGDNNEEVPFSAITTFNIRRIDDANISQEFVGDVVGNVATFVITPDFGILHATGDSTINTDDGIINHIYSVKSDTNVYMQGKLKLIEVA